MELSIGSQSIHPIPSTVSFAVLLALPEIIWGKS
ncbi:hypothetical protein BFJ63_vAg423 [Fusarium oxysporum f. sp. narcissi]|uniref:Uncharacterized protein n=1 Tax=Fusarium oxysporum f. sp. narcissi TaxID=451672 RepID=A0A4Q2WAS1_FUSOX|nr:hypothetical protein BFJ63_vAg423 [Fusarium oxysporum f. sp. narcissi]